MIRFHTPIDPHSPTPSRLPHLAALAVTVALGLASRLFPLGFHLWDKSLGDALYAVAAYLVLALLLPRRSAWFIAALALAFCFAVELFQLTGIPARFGHLLLVRWVLGRGFLWHDLACYAIGVAAVTALDLAFFRRAWKERGAGYVSPAARDGAGGPGERDEPQVPGAGR